MAQLPVETGSWTELLRTGIGAWVDSQAAKQYAVNDPKYNTAGGTGGQSQATPLAQQANSLLLIGGGVLLVAVVLIFALRR